jgi:hypothetical protein
MTKSAGTPESIKAFIGSEIEAWRALVKELDIQPQ